MEADWYMAQWIEKLRNGVLSKLPTGRKDTEELRSQLSWNVIGSLNSTDLCPYRWVEK